MDRVGLVSVSWRQGGAVAIERFTTPTEQHDELVARLFHDAGLEEVVYVATCNRIEVVFVGDSDTPLGAYRPILYQALTGQQAEPGQAERALRAWIGEGAAEHLLLVTAGLDSARVGETEIAGQVRRGYDRSRRLGTTGPRLELLFEEALRLARQVHLGSGVSQGSGSLAVLAVKHLKRRLARAAGPVALIGVSDMTRRAAEQLGQDGQPLLMINRTREKAVALARRHGGEARSLSEFRERPDPVEAILLATGSSRPILSRSDLERIAARTPSGRPPLVVDLCIPPNVAADVAASAGVPRIGMDEILDEAQHNRQQRLVKMADARQMVDEALLGLRRRIADRVLSPVLAAVQQRFRETALKGVDRLFARELACLGATEREAVVRWAETLARRFAHLPARGLRGVAYENGNDAVAAFLRHVEDPALAEALRSAAAREGRCGPALPRQEDAT